MFEKDSPTFVFSKNPSFLEVSYDLWDKIKTDTVSNALT
jgi:hypothetical protein